MNRPPLKNLLKLESASGTEAVVYLQDDMAFRVADYDKHVETYYKSLIDSTIDELVKIFDVWREGDFLIIRMQRLNKLDTNGLDDFELHYFYVNNTDNVTQVESYLPCIKCSLLKQTLSVQIHVAKALNLNAWDFGPHNVMVDENNKMLVVDP